MAQLINVKLSRFDACPWGFRLQGGKDFGAPLLIQKVNGGSPAEKAGLQAGDAVIKVNEVEVFNLRHKEAQDQIVRAGNNFELMIQRGGSTWKPQVSPVGPSPVIGSHNIQPVTKTSLAAKPQATPHIGSGHNFAPKPFGGQQVNGDATVKSIVNKQYNTPVGIYSEETIAETLSAQAEVLAGGVLGVNFKKNEKTYNPATSEVLKMVQEIDSEPRMPEPVLSSTSFYATQSHAVGGRATSPRPLTPIARQLQSPTIPRSQTPTNVPTDTPKCSDCERYIIGGKAPTGALPASLAKAASTAAAKTIIPTYAPAPAPAPAPARPAPAPAPAPAPSSPQSNLAPLPFHQSPSSLAGPKPFSTPAAPTTSPARPAPAGSKFVWPPRAEEQEPTPTATPLYIPPSPHLPRPSTPKAAAVAVKSSPKPISPAPVSNISQRVAPVASQPSTITTQPSPKVAPATNLPPVLPAQPLSNLESIKTSLPMPVTKPSTKVAPFPQPFSEYIAKHRSAMISVASPTPPQQPALFEQPISMQSQKISEKVTQGESTGINKRLSVCSEEVLSINAEKTVPKFETLTECLTPDGVQRPASPVPMQEVSQASSNLDIASEVESFKQEASEVKEEVSDIVTKKQLSTAEECISEEVPMLPLKDTQQSDETISAFLKSEESMKESMTQEVSIVEQKKEELVTSQQSIKFSEIQASSQISIEKQEIKSEFVSTQSSTQSSSSFVPVSKEQQQSASQFQQHTRQLSFEKNSMLTSTASTALPTSSHLNRAQECSSPMVSALTIAPDRPYSPLPSATKPALSSPVVMPKISQAPISSEVQTSIASRSEACSSPMVSALTIAPDRPYSPLPSATKIPASSGTEAPPSFTQSPTLAPKVQPVLPTQTNPSFMQPPTQPIQPIQPAPASPIYIPTPSKTVPAAVPLGGSIPSEGCPSPMLSALTIASDRPYSPFSTVTKIPGSLPTHIIPISKPAAAVAPPPVPVSSVSREEACPSPMVAALTIAPERPYSPLTPITQAPRFEAAHTQKQLQTSFAPVQPMVPKKIGTQLPVSKVLPVTTAPKYSFPPPSITQAPSFITQSKPAPSKSVPQPKVSAPTVQQLPVIGAFRPIVAPNAANTFRPISQETSQPQAVPPEHSLPPRPQTPKARTATPTSGARDGTPKISTLTGLHKPATIPYYQLEIGEYPGQRPSSATPTCPMTDPQAPQARTPQPLQQTATPASFPFPNIPFPEGVRPGAAPPSQTFRPIPQPSVSKQTSTAPVHKPSPTPVSATQIPTSIAKTPSVPNAGGGGSIGGSSSGDKRGVAGSTAPRRGKGVLTQPQGGGRIPMCASCSLQIRGPFITALGKTWCPEHFICVNAQCRRPLADIGFVEEKGELYCEYCFEKYLAPTCDKCGKKVKGDCLNAIGKHFHPECFLCAYCGKLFGNNPFFLEDGLPYCEADWNELFTTKCFACGFPIEAGDRWVEALSNNYHSQCFNCTACKKNLEGQSFYAKGGRPFCKAHAR